MVEAERLRKCEINTEIWEQTFNEKDHSSPIKMNVDKIYVTLPAPSFQHPNFAPLIAVMELWDS
jgi:hypothetical protein